MEEETPVIEQGTTFKTEVGTSLMDQVTPRYYSEDDTTKDDEIFKCKDCDKVFKKKYNLQVHTKIHEEHPKITCELCDLHFHDKSNYNRHMTSKHKNRALKRKRRKVLPLKLKLKAPFPKSSSPQASSPENSPTKLTIKVDSEEGCSAEEGLSRSERLTCKVCRREFLDKDGLKKHVEKYSTKKHYKCTSCEKCFHYRTSWVRHEECHKTERKVWPCDTCDMTFTQKVSLKRHKESNKNPCNGEFRITEFRKKECTSRLNRQQSNQMEVYNMRGDDTEDEDDDLLDDDRDEGDDEKTAISDEVDATNNTTNSSINNDHIQKGVSLYACNFCGKVFHYRSLWTRHEKEHLSTHKSFQCHICGTKFTRQFYLSRHRKICFRSRLHGSAV